jgi:hypothetical protein
MHPDIIFGSIVMFAVISAMGFVIWRSVKKGTFKWYSEGGVALASIIICFVICFPLLFGPHPPR